MEFFDQEGNVVYSNMSPNYTAPNKDGLHTEAQTVDWAEGEVTSHMSANVKSIKLILYTYKVPCAPSSANCSGNLGSGTWQRQIAGAAGLPASAVTISVWTSWGQNAGSVKPWP